jgi:alpha-L-fucosidase
MKKSSFIVVLLYILFFSQGSVTAQETSKETETKMQWFKDAKLGIFIHWGLYAVNGIDESWSFYNGYISYEDYMKQM